MARVFDLDGASPAAPFTINKAGKEKEILSKPATIIRTANQRLEDAKTQADILPMFGGYLGKGQLVILFADTKVGKTILAVQLADSFSRGISCLTLPNAVGPQKTLYYDFELSDKQFEKRYKHYVFSDNLFVSTLNKEDTNRKFSLEQVEKDIRETGAQVVVIDNITALTMQNLSEGEAAMSLMKELCRLKLIYGTTFLVLAHTPKIASHQPLNQNHLAGSKMLQNFCDGIIGIGKSIQGKGIRYIKNVMNRDFEAEEEVISCQIIEDQRGVLCYGMIDFSYEEEHLEKKEKANISAKSELKMRAMDLKAEGKTLREIADILNVGKSTIDRLIKDPSTERSCSSTFEQEVNSDHDRSAVPDLSHCPTVPELGQMGQMGQAPVQEKELATKILSGYVDRGKIALIKAIMFFLECSEASAQEHFTRLIESGYVIGLGQDTYILKE